MIDPKELRLGNWYNRKHGKGWTPTVTTEEIIGGIFSAELRYALDDFEPIPITAEWLKANGFADTQDSYYRRCIQNEDTLSPTMLVISRGFAEITRSGIGAIAASCKYVHQVQNLIYALTGEELTVKEKV